MAFPIIPIVSALAAAGSGALGFLGAREQRETQWEVLQEQQRFQRAMSQTAYQRAVRDMRKAGINPMLAYQQGGASTPQGGTMRPENLAAGSVNSALAAKALTEQIRNNVAIRRKTNAEAQSVENQNWIFDVANAHMVEKIVAEGSIAQQQALQAQIATQIADLGVPRAKVESAFYEGNFAQINEWLRRIPGIGQMAPELIRMFKGLIAARGRK